mmetsp:Transcript_3273/g.6995  ORF Transcript_3273/g.6995 Transcript_3273/m.6995 type:complete len:244 (-) Transcript_3273:783-1514(-)
MYSFSNDPNCLSASSKVASSDAEASSPTPPPSAPAAEFLLAETRLTSRSSSASFIHTFGLGARAQAFWSKMRARSNSSDSHSSFAAASQMSSLSGLALNASTSTSRALPTSPPLPCHFSFAQMSQSTSACGQWFVAVESMLSRVSGVPCFRSRSQAAFQRPFLVGNTLSAWAYTARAVSTDDLARQLMASSSHVRFRSSSSTPRHTEFRTMAAHVRGAPARSAASASFSHWSRSITTWSRVST